MTHTQRSRVAGVGVAVGAVSLFGSLWLGCAPGELPCNKPEWAQVCMEMPGGGAGGTTGGTTGGTSPTGGTGGSGGGGAVTAATVVQNCPEYNTLGKMDMFFGMRCGVAALCHMNMIPWTDLKSPNVFMRLVDAKPRAACLTGGTAKIIDKANWQNSVMLTKSRMPSACPEGTAAATGAGFTMPPPEADQGTDVNPKQPPLSAQERTCIENFIKAATGN